MFFWLIEQFSQKKKKKRYPNGLTQQSGKVREINCRCTYFSNLVSINFRGNFLIVQAFLCSRTLLKVHRFTSVLCFVLIRFRLTGSPRSQPSVLFVSAASSLHHAFPYKGRVNNFVFCSSNQPKMKTSPVCKQVINMIIYWVADRVGVYYRGVKITKSCFLILILILLWKQLQEASHHINGVNIHQRTKCARPFRI